MSHTASRNGLSKLHLIGILVSGVIVVMAQFVYIQAVVYPGFFGDDGVTTTVVKGEYIEFRMRAPETAIEGEYINNQAGCTSVRYVMDNHGLTVEAYAQQCQTGPEQFIRNGRHGSYKTLDDVENPIDVEEVDTSIGTAQVFMQEYSEHTNISREWEEPVAIVTFDSAVNPDFPTMVVMSHKAALSREHFTAIVSGLKPVYN